MKLPGLTSEQEMLSDSAAKFLAREWGDGSELRRTQGAYATPAHWSAMAELGWLGIGLPEDCGGAGGALETMLLMERFGASLFASPFLSSVVLCGRMIADGTQGARRRETLDSIVGGRQRLAFAGYEGGRAPLHDVGTTATRAGDAYVLRGRKIVVLDGTEADALVVLARTSGARTDTSGLTLFLVPASLPGVVRQPCTTYDGRRAADVRFDDARLSHDAAIGPADGAWPIVQDAIDRAIVAVCAEALGAMDAAVALTLDYLKTRKQFGRAIGTFQALQHRIVDAYVATEESRSMVVAAAVALDGPGARRRRMVHAAKIFVGNAARLVAEECVQMHGGVGIADEFVIGHYFKRLLAIDALFGDADEHAGAFPLN